MTITRNSYTQFFAFVIACNLSLQANAADKEVVSRNLMTCRRTVLFSSDGRHLADLEPCVGLEIWIPPQNFQCPANLGATGVPVAVMGIATNPQNGWVAEPDLIDLARMREEVKQWLPSIEGNRFGDVKLPQLIAIQPDPIIHSAWKDVDLAIRVNEGLPVSERSPVPWVNRGRLWRLVGNHHDALRDFVKAASLMRESDSDLSEYIEHFVTLEGELKQNDQKPMQPYISESKYYFSEGTQEFRCRKYDKALLNFYDAVQLNPSRPIYWYARALTFKELQMDSEAERDVRIGVQIEVRHRKQNSSDYSKEVPRMLEKIPTKFRVWLEGYRQGSHESWRPDPSAKNGQQPKI